MSNESFILLALALATKQILKLLVDIPMSRMTKAISMMTAAEMPNFMS